MKDIYQLHAQMCKTFSSPARLEVLDLLSKSPLSVTEIVEKSGLGQANASQHLSIMKYSGVVFSKRAGRNVVYHVANPKIVKAFAIIKEVLTEKLNKDGKIVRKQ